MIFTSTLSIKKKIDANLVFTKTNSLTYEINSEDVYEEVFKQKHFSAYQSKFSEPNNKKSH